MPPPELPGAAWQSSKEKKITKLKALGLAAVAAMAITAFAASSASATTLEVGGVVQNGPVALSLSLKTGTSMILPRTDGSLGQTCTASSMQGTTSAPFTGPNVTAPLSTLSWTACERPMSVHKKGTLHIAHAGGTNATVSSSGFEVTQGSPFGTLNCKTGAGTTLGTLTGKASGHAELHLNAVINCGFLVPSSVWKGTYVVTSPTGLGVVA